MLYLQVVFSMLIGCLLGLNSPYELAFIVLGAIIPNTDNLDRMRSNGVRSKGFLHSLTFGLLCIIFSFFWNTLTYIGIGIIGHVIIEFLSSESKIAILSPLPFYWHLSIFKQYRWQLTFSSILISIFLLAYFIDIYTVIDIFAIYVKGIIYVFLFLLESIMKGIDYLILRLSN